MSAIVPYVPRLIPTEGVSIGKPVRADRWDAIAATANHALGRGRVLIPDSALDAPLVQGPNALRFYVFPAYQATHRVWECVLTVTGSTGFCDVTFTDPSGGASRILLGAAGDYHLMRVEEITSRGSSEVELAVDFTVAVASTKNATVQSIKCWEVPRPSLALDANDHGTDLATLIPTAPIYDAQGVSAGGTYDASTNAWATAARAGLFQFARVTPGLTVTSGTYVAMFAAPVPLLGRKFRRTSTTKTATAWLRVSSGAGTAGDFRLTMTNGYTHTFTVGAATSPTWMSDTITIDCEDNAVDDGRRSTRDDLCLIEGRRTSGASTVRLESVSIING